MARSNTEYLRLVFVSSMASFCLELETTMRNCSVVLHLNELCIRVWLPWHFSPTHSASQTPAPLISQTLLWMLEQSHTQTSPSFCYFSGSILVSVFISISCAWTKRKRNSVSRNNESRNSLIFVMLVLMENLQNHFFCVCVCVQNLPSAKTNTKLNKTTTT